jgi:hypothetical protein
MHGHDHQGEQRLHRHHHASPIHPPASVHPSILRMAALQRLVAAAVVIMLLWLAAFWAMA